MDETFRVVLIEQCCFTVKEKIEVIKDALQQAYDALLMETKSSAGDKYETAREMIQQDLDRLQRQLAEADRDRVALTRIDRETNASGSVRVGSMVLTDRALYFLCIGLGLVECRRRQVHVLSPKSPVGRLLIGKAVGDVIEFNGLEQKVLAVS